MPLQNLSVGKVDKYQVMRPVVIDVDVSNDASPAGALGHWSAVPAKPSWESDILSNRFCVKWILKLVHSHCTQWTRQKTFKAFTTFGTLVSCCVRRSCFHSPLVLCFDFSQIVRAGEVSAE